MANYSSRDFNNSATVPYPLAFLLDAKLSGLPYSEKEMYAYLKRRMNLSLQNKKIYEDENGLFVFYRQAEIAEELHISERQVRKIFHGMAEHGLIETRKQGMGLPQKIYIKNVADLTMQSGTNGAGLSGTNGAGLSGTNGAGLSGTNGAGLSGTNGAGPYSKRIENRGIENRGIENKEEGTENLFASTKKKRPMSKIVEDLLLQFAGSNEELAEALLAWRDMRKEMKKVLTDRSANNGLRDLQKLSGGDEMMMIKIIDRTIDHTWLGFFPLPNDYAVKKSSNQPKGDEVLDALRRIDEQREISRSTDDAIQSF